MSNYNKEERRYQISEFNRENDNRPQMEAVSWEEMSKRLITFETRESKKGGRLWSGASYAPGSTRCNENVLEVSVAGLDFDDGITIEKLEAMTRGLACVIYTSYNHTAEAPRLRLVLPLSRPVSAADWTDIWHRLNQRFGGQLDKQTKDCCRMFYYPASSQANEGIRFAKVYAGEILDPYTLPEAPAARTDKLSRQPRSEPLTGSAVEDEEEVTARTLGRVKDVFGGVWSTRRAGVDGDDSRIDGSAVDFSVLLTLVNKNFSYAAVKAGFEADVHPGHFRKVLGQGRRKEALQYLERSYQKAVEAPDREAFLQQCAATKRRAALLRRSLQALNWPGVRRRNVLKVLQAHITVYERCGRESWGLSVRECCEISRVGIATVSSIHRDLIAEGWLSGVPNGGFRFGPRLLEMLAQEETTSKEAQRRREILEAAGKAAVLDVPSIDAPSDNCTRIEQTPHSDTCGVCSDTVQIEPLHKLPFEFPPEFPPAAALGQSMTFGVFERSGLGGLGQAGESIWLALQGKPLSLTQLVEQTGLHRNTIRKSLKKLELCSIVTRVGRLVRATPDFDFQALSIELGTQELAQRRRAKHAAQRAQYQEGLQRFRQTAAPGLQAADQQDDRLQDDQSPEVEPMAFQPGAEPLLVEERAPQPSPASHPIPPPSKRAPRQERAQELEGAWSNYRLVQWSSSL